MPDGSLGPVAWKSMHACVCVCFCVGESGGSDKNSWGFQSGQEFAAVFPQACSSFLSSVLTDDAGEHLRSLSALDKWLIRLEVDLVQGQDWVSAGRLSVISEEEKCWWARQTPASERSGGLCTRERARARASASCGGRRSWQQRRDIDPTYLSPSVSLTRLFIKMEMESCCSHVQRQRLWSSVSSHMQSLISGLHTLYLCSSPMQSHCRVSTVVRAHFAVHVI